MTEPLDEDFANLDQALADKLQANANRLERLHRQDIAHEAMRRRSKLGLKLLFDEDFRSAYEQEWGITLGELREKTTYKKAL